MTATTGNVDALAEEARAAEADLAAARAKLKEANDAAAAAERTRRERGDERQEAWALAVVAEYPQRIQEATARVDKAWDAFSETVRTDFGRSADAYLTWQRAAVDGNAVAKRLQEARSWLRHLGYFLRDSAPGAPFLAVRRIGFSADRNPSTNSVSGALGLALEDAIRSYQAEVSAAFVQELEDVRAGAVTPPAELVEQGQRLAFEVVNELEVAVRMRSEQPEAFRRLDQRVQRQVERYLAARGGHSPL